MKEKGGPDVVYIEALDVRIILPPPGREGPIFWFRGRADSRGNRKDAANRRIPDGKKKGKGT